MKPEQQRIAIARACGEDNDSILRGLIPDYLNDLNAMHEAEQTMGDPRCKSIEKSWCTANIRKNKIL